ncbi:FAD-dependent oxidoreductase [Streptomyces sp. 15-116A]|uniref:flavin monoamine oxidase family protein n=1 Tax=Streptomyces sp. 15-116A TaxID=2259035 RepID=UPI0021B3CBDE|nr:NAD(P)/FAD-dependent oxidoreductase [Streptomyces sp. 15-116A]MCT7350677.1 FAD-dependent oxidoreductase [Streptomyces sp. 15-116A]
MTNREPEPGATSAAPPVGEKTCDVVVIGAGMAGLMAATTLVGEADVIVLEAAERAGGRVETVRKGEYWINVGAQFTEGTGPLIDALHHHGIEMGSLAGKRVALALNGGLVDTAKLSALMFRTRMSFMDWVGMAMVGARILSAVPFLESNSSLAKRVRARLDRRLASDLLRGVRSRLTHDMVRSWSGQWMGCEPGETAATQLVTSIGVSLTDPAKVPNFALPVGGNQTLTDILAADLGERLRLRSAVRSVEQDEDGVVVDYVAAGRPVRVRAKRAVVAVPSDVAVRILPRLPQRYRNAFDDIRYGRYVVVGFFTEEEGPQPWDDFFGVSTPQLSFQAIFNHAAATRKGGVRKPGGALACFAGGAVADDLFELSDEEIVARFTTDLLSVYPQLEGKLGEGIVRRHHRVVPFWAPWRRASLPTLREPLGPIHLAGDYQLDMPSLADAATSGENAAKAVLASLRR